MTLEECGCTDHLKLEKCGCTQENLLKLEKCGCTEEQCKDIGHSEWAMNMFYIKPANRVFCRLQESDLWFFLKWAKQIMDELKKKVNILGFS